MTGWPLTSSAWLHVGVVAAVLAALAASGHAVLYKRDSRGAVLWVGLIWGLPFLGPALLRAPLLAAQMLSDSDYVAGLSARLSADGSRLELRFAREAAARGFAAVNRDVGT